MSYKHIKQEIENISQDHIAGEFYYTDKGECFHLKNEKSEKIFESIDHKTNKVNARSKSDKTIDPNDQNLLSSQEINNGIKFSSVFSGKNIIIHGGGTIATLGNANNEDYVLVGGIVPRGMVYIEFICPISCQGLFFGMATLNEIDDLSNLKKNFKSFRTSSRRRVGLEINYEQRIVKFFLEGILKDKIFTIKEKTSSFPCIILNNKNVSVILNPFARLSNETFPLYLASDSIYRMPNKTIFSRMLFLTNVPKVKIESNLNFIKTHFKIESIKQENIVIPTNTDGEAKGIIILNLENENEQNNFKENNKSVRINNNEIKILEDNYLNDLSEKSIFKVIDLISMTEKDNIKLDISFKKLNSLESIKNDNSEEDKLIVEYIIENFNKINFFEYTINQMLDEIERTSDYLNTNRLVDNLGQRKSTEEAMLRENTNLRIEYLSQSDKMFLIDNEAIKVFERNSQGFFDYEFYYKESKNFLNLDNLRGFSNQKKSIDNMINILIGKNELSFFLKNIPWNNIMSEIIDYQILKSLNNFINGIRNLKLINPDFVCFPLKKNYSRKFIEIILNYLNRIVFIMKEKNKISNLPNHKEETQANVEMDQFLPFAPDYEEPLNEENKKQCFFDEYKNFSTENILLLYKITIKILEQIEVVFPISNEKHSSISQCIRWGSAYSRLSTFVNFPNMMDKISVFDLANRGFYVDHTLYNELKFHGHNFFRSLNYNKIKDHESLDSIINQEYPFNFTNLSSYWPNVELSHTINSIPAKIHQDLFTKDSSNISLFNKSNIAQLLITCSENGLTNIWDYTLGLNLLGSINVKKGIKEVNSFSKIAEVFWLKLDCDINSKSLKSLTEILNEENFDVNLINGSNKGTPELGREKDKVNVSNELVNNLYIMGFPIEACKLALKCNKNNFDKALEYLLDKSSDPQFIKQFESPKTKKLEEEEVKIPPWNCEMCTYLNTKGNLNCEMCSTLIPEKILNEHVEFVNKRKEEEKINLSKIVSKREEQIIHFKDCLIKNVHVLFDKNDPMAPVLVCSILFDFIYNKTIISVYKFMINPIILRDFISCEKDFYISTIDNRKFNKLEEVLSYLIDNYSNNILSLYPQFNKGINSISYNSKSNFITLIPIEHYHRELSVNSYFDSFTYENPIGKSELVILSESVNSEININHFTINNKSKANNLGAQSINLELNQYNLNDHFLNEFPTELKIIKDIKFTYIIDYTQIRKFNVEMDLVEIIRFNSIGLFKKIEPIYDSNFMLKSVKIYDDVNKFTEVFLDNLNKKNNNNHIENLDKLSSQERLNDSLQLISPDKLDINEIEYLSNLLNFEKVDIKLNNRDRFAIVKGNNSISSKKIFVDLQLSNNKNSNNFEIEFTNNIPLVISNINFYFSSKNKKLKTLNYCSEDLFINAPQNISNIKEMNIELENKNDLHNLIPLTVTDFKGAQFQQFINVSSILFGKNFTSNYFKPEFLFSHIHEKIMSITSVVVGSELNSKTGEIPFGEGLLFLINDIESISLAHEFTHFDISNFSNFLKDKEQRKEDFFEWEPVAYINMGEKEYIRTKIYESRPCKYILLLPTNARSLPKNYKKGFNTSVMSLNLFAAEGTVYPNEFEKAEYLNRSAKSLLANNCMEEDIKLNVKITASGETVNNVTLKEFENLKINGIIPNTFCSFENTDIFISKNNIENLVFPDKLVSSIKLEIDQLDLGDYEFLGFTVECLTFKKVDESSVMSLTNLKNIDVHSLRTNLIDKDKFEMFNQKLCDLLISENADFKKKHAIIKYFDCLILRIPSMIDKICTNLDLTKFIILNILQNEDDHLISSSLTFLISVKLSLKNENLINSVFEILDNFESIKISYSGLNSFILLIKNTFNEANINTNDSNQMKQLYNKLLTNIENCLINLNEKFPLSKEEIFIKNFIKTEEFPLDDKLFCVNKEEVAKTTDINQNKFITNNCFAENNNGVIRFTIDLFKIYNVKSIKLNFSINDQTDHYFKLTVWGSNSKTNDKSKEDFKILYIKNYLDDMWKQLTKYESEMKANEKFFLSKDIRSLEIPNLNHNCRYLMIEINSNQAQRFLKKLPQITIIPEIVGEFLYDKEPYSFKSVDDLFEGFITNKIESVETLYRKYNVKYSLDNSKYIIYTQEDNYDSNINKKVKNSSSENIKNEHSNSIINMKNSLKSYQNLLENSVSEYIKNIESFDLIAENKLKANIQNIISLQKNISAIDKKTNYKELKESQYTLLNYFIKEISSLIDKSNIMFQQAFSGCFENSDKKEKFVIYYIETLILNAIGENKDDAIFFLDNYIWNLLSKENFESIFNLIFDKFIAKESEYRSSRVLLEGISKINFDITIVLNKLKSSFDKVYDESEIPDGFYSISSLIFILIMKIKNEKNKNNIKYDLLIDSSLKMINDLTKEIKFVKEVDDLILSHVLNLLQESYSQNSFESLNNENDSQLVDFMIETLLNLWNKDYIKNKLFLIIDKMIDPLSIIESIRNKEIIQGDFINILKYTQNVFINVQIFTRKFLQDNSKEINDSSNSKIAYILDLNNKILSIHSHLYNQKNSLSNDKCFVENFENIKDKSFEIVAYFLTYFKKLNSKKIGMSIENNLWIDIFNIISCGDLKRLIKNNLLENLIFDTFLNCNDDLKDNLYSKIIKIFSSLYTNEKEISEELNDQIILIILKLINSIEKSEKIILPFLNQLLELVSCGENPFTSKKNEKLVISDKIKETLFIQASNYIIKYLNYSSYTGSTSSNKLIIQHLNIGISLLHIVHEFANDYLFKIEDFNSDISFSIRNYLIFITFNQYADYTNVPPTVVKISTLSSFANKIIDMCCKRKKLIEIILTEFMTIVRKIDDKLLTKIRNSEISIKKGIVISKKLYYSLDLILNKCLYDDEITKFFAFDLQGFKFFVERVNRHKNISLFDCKSTNKISSKLNYKLNKELFELLTEESKSNQNLAKAQEDELFTENLNDLNYEEFALNGKLNLLDDPVNINTTSINWSNKKKGANSYVLTRDLKDKTYYEDVFSFKLNSVIEPKNVFIAFSYSTNPERVSGIVPSVFFLAGETPEKMDCCLKLEKIDDHAYIEKSIFTYGFNFFASDPKNLTMDNNYIENLFDQLINCKAKYFKFIIRRPIITANENSLQNKTNNVVSICLNHVSIFGTKIADMSKVIEFIQEEEKNVSIKIISKIFTAEFIDTLKYFAEDSTLINNIKEIYDAYEPYIEKHADILSNILINVSKYVYELGEWLLNRLLNVDNTEIHAKLAVEITQNNPEYVNERVNKYLSFIIDELSPESPIFYSNNKEAKLKNLGKFADYLTIILNGLTVSPFFENSLTLNLDLNKFISIIKNLEKYNSIKNEINKLITILLIPNKKLVITNYLDAEEAIHLLHNFYLETNYYEYALILSYLVSNNQYYEKFAVKRKIINFYFDQFLDQVNNGLRGKNMLSLMQIMKNFSFSNSVITIIQENNYDFRILEAIKNKDPKSDTILINNNSSFLENVVTFLKNSIIKREDCHKQLAKILIEDLEVCKQKIDKIYANNILMPLLRMESTVNLSLHPIDSFFNSILSAYCNIGHLTTNIKEEALDTIDSKFIVGSSLSPKAVENLQKILKAHNFPNNHKFNHKTFSLRLTSESLSSNYVKTFTEGISELNNILILFYSGKPQKNCNNVTAFFLETKFPHINESDSSEYPEFFIPYSDKNILIQVEGDKYNKSFFKNYSSSESIGEFVIEDGYISLHFYSESDNPIKIYISPEEGIKKEFTVKINDKSIDKSFDLEFKPLNDGYFEIFTSSNNIKTDPNKALVRRDSMNLSSGKITPSKFIDTNGNLDFEKIKSMKYYKKSHPLLVTRNNPVYEIPSNITIKHLKNLFGSGELSFKFLVDQQTLKDENQLLELTNKSMKLINNQNILDICYDVNQLRGIVTISNDEQTSIQNYEPQLPVYKAFEKLDGIMKIISVLKSSILKWKNKEAADNWLKWIDDVEKFSVLPTFFSTLIRHQKCFNIIFDLLCGIYDQENFNKEICIETSNYIYEIINNTFVATESSNLRYIAIEKGIFNNILQKLEILTREKPRKFKIDHQVEEKVDENKNKITQTNKPADEKKSKKGVGYGSDHTGDNRSWDVNSYLENKKSNSEQIAAIIKLLANFFNTKELQITEELNRLILESVILPVLESAYRGGTLLELAKQDTLYYAYLDLTLKLCENKNLIPYLLDISKDYKPPQSDSVYTLLGQLNEGAKIFSNCIKGGTNEEISHEEKLAAAINKTYEIVSLNIKAYQKYLQSDKDYNLLLKLPLEKSYSLLMRELSFDYMNMKDSNGKMIHYYASSLTKDSNPSKLIRLAQEYADLSRALPCEYTNSIFVRVDKQNMDFLKVLIMGSAGTPYAHGAFEFDVNFDSNYPAGPPKVTLVTTGSGSVRFNPNLYSNGKVCLSLLGTWRGNSTENWDPKISTFLQVLISIQSIIMSDLVYFNEPSCEAEMGKPEGEARNEAYSNIVKYCNIKYAMIEQLKKPSKGFEEVIQRHFYLKKNQILEEVKQWLQKSKTTVAKYTSFSYDHNPSWAQKMNSQSAFAKMMEDIYVELEKELNELPIPSELKKKQEESEKNSIKKKNADNNEFDYISLENVDVTYENDHGESNKEINIHDEAVKDRWSRYIGAMGIDAVQRQANSNIFLSGASGLGIEIAKNLVLSGCKKFVLHDEKKTSYLDLSSQFFLSEDDVGYNRAEKCIKKLQQLNFYVKVVSNTNHIPKSEELLDTFGLQEFNIIILTECDAETLIAVNKYCRKRNIIFINADLYGVFGRVINDFGTKFTVNDVDGEELKDCMIKSITNEKEGLVTVLENTRHNFQDGDEIIISEVIGMKNINNDKGLIFIDVKEKKSQLNSINETKHIVKVKNPQSFYIGDTTGYTSYERNGMAKQIKSIKTLEFNEIEKVLFDKELSAIDQNMAISDFTKIAHTTPLHIGFQAINDFKVNFNHLPSPWNMEDFKKLLEIAEKISQDYKYELTYKDKKLLAFLSFTSQTQFNPMAAFFGGLIAQEAVKAMTGKFMPIKQIFYYDAIEVLPGFEIKEDEQIIQNIEKLVQSEDYKLFNNRIDGIRTIVGKGILEKIRKMKILVVGAGAIGCELLKNFGMLEVGSSNNTNKIEEKEKNGIIVTDPDIIEVSNLNRQFLFREKHLRLPKSSTAAAAVIQMNKNLKNNIYAKLDKVWEETEHIFTDKFFSSLSLVANALDNIRARRYVDSRCVSNRIPLLESGTLGPKGHVQVVVPFKTESYSSQQDPEVSTDIPQCTLKMFPEEALHCIEWARDLFGKLFTQKPKNLNRILDEGIESQEFKIIKQALNLLKHKPENFDDCIKLAREKFEKLFRNNIKQLMFSYPLDKKNKDGSLFWSLPKRPPNEVIYNPKDPLHYSFIAAYSCLIAKQFKIKIPYENPRKEESKMDIAEKGSKVQLPEFKINTLKAKEIEKQVEKEKKEVEETSDKDKDKIDIENKINDDEKNLDNLINQFKNLSEKYQLNKYSEVSEKEKKQMELTSEEFEKDNDANFHIDIIYAMSNLRCRNYKLEEMDWMKVKIKAGKIIPALATTTASIAGLQALELVKLAKNMDIEHIRNSFLNLAIPYLQASEPGPVSKNKISEGLEVTLWDRWEFKPEKNNLQSVYDYLKNKYNLFPRDCFLGKKAVFPYNAYVGEDKKEIREEILNKDLFNLLGISSDEELIDLMITFTANEKSEEYIKNTPPVRILFK